MTHLLDLLLHADRSLLDLVTAYGRWIYAILFLIVFAETGFVVTPFLPGDSLLFAIGTFTALGSLDLAGELLATALHQFRDAVQDLAAIHRGLGGPTGERPARCPDRVAHVLA